MAIFKDIAEAIFGVALFINALLFIPQAFRIVKEKTARGVSITTFVGFLLIQLATVVHGILANDIILVIGYVLSMLTCGTVIILVLAYRRKDLTKKC